MGQKSTFCVYSGIIYHWKRNLKVISEMGKLMIGGQTTENSVISLNFQWFWYTLEKSKIYKYCKDLRIMLLDWMSPSNVLVTLKTIICCLGNIEPRSITICFAILFKICKKFLNFHSCLEEWNELPDDAHMWSWIIS